VLLSFSSLITSILAAFIWRIVVVVDALLIAWRKRRGTDQMPVNLKIAATVLIVLLAFLPVPERFLQYFTYFRAYSVTSDSMCPTLCPDDNFVADASFFKGARAKPRRHSGSLTQWQRHGFHQANCRTTR
jgi:hypothetical protein